VFVQGSRLPRTVEDEGVEAALGAGKSAKELHFLRRAVEPVM